MPKKAPTLLFQRKPYWIFRPKVPCKGAVQNTGKILLPAKDCNEILVMKLFVRKSCPKHRRQHLNTVVKSTVQKLPITPSKIMFERRQYPKARLKKLFRNAARNTVVNGFRKKRLIEKFVEKYQLKHCPILRHFFFRNRPYRKSPQQVPCKRAIQNTGKSLLSWRDCIEEFVKNFLYWTTNENAEKPRFRKKTVSKILSKSMSYTEVAYNTVETPLSGNRSDSRVPSNSNRTKNQPKTPLNFFSIKSPYRILFWSVAYKKVDRKTVKRLLSKKENLPHRSFHQSSTLKSLY